MNKKLFLGMFAAAGMLLATSCSNDELDVVQSENEAQVTFSLGLEGGIATRAISDGTGAKKLVYAVYKLDADGTPVLQNVVGSDNNGQFVDTEAFDGGLTEKVSVTLAKDQTYQVAFWAQNPKCSAYTTTDLTNVGVNYNKASNNQDVRDAFFKTVEFTVKGNQTIDVELKRPFAQINVGVYKTDWEAAVKSGIEIEKSSVVIKDAATSINLLTGEVGDETTDVEVSYLSNTIPDEDLKVDLNGDGSYDNGNSDIDEDDEKYKWLSMSYILVADRNADTDNSGVLGDERATLESLQYTFSPKSGNNITFGDGLNSVPVQRNWRTNILGKLLTGDITFNITIDPIYDGDINVDAPVTTVVSTLDELKEAFAKGGYIVLKNDIKFEKITSVEPGADVYMDLNGKTITVDEETTSNTLIWVKDGAKLTIDGNGTIDMGDVSTMAIFCPYGELVIENGTFIRNKVTNVTNNTTGLFMGAKNSGCNVTINGGYFDPGYYDTNAADIEDILAGTTNLSETADDIAKRGKPGDNNIVRVAVKDNVSVLLNHSGYGSFKVYGGTFVGANPAWGDEGCMLPTTPNYLRPWSYYQGALLAGQTFNENGLVIPDGYTITKTTNSDDVPVYTVTYNK